MTSCEQGWANQLKPGSLILRYVMWLVHVLRFFHSTQFIPMVADRNLYECSPFIRLQTHCTPLLNVGQSGCLIHCVVNKKLRSNINLVLVVMWPNSSKNVFDNSKLFFVKPYLHQPHLVSIMSISSLAVFLTKCGQYVQRYLNYLLKSVYYLGRWKWIMFTRVCVLFILNIFVCKFRR